MIPFLVSTLAMGLSGLWVFIYYCRKGQFEEIEESKYQMFRDEE